MLLSLINIEGNHFGFNKSKTFKHLEHKIKIILNSIALIAKKIFEVSQDGLTINLQYLENNCWLEQDTHNVMVHLKKEFNILPLY